jgi:hypothetical protein
MARLRREEEQRAYERMINPPLPVETFASRFPNAKAFAEVNRPQRDIDLGEDDVTYSDVHRQLILIFNFLASIFGVAATLWVLARWWSTPARIFLAMGGGILVGVAEVALYSGYIWHLGQAKKKDKKMKEVKQVMQTWVVGGDEDEGQDVTRIASHLSDEGNLRRRKQKDPT